jgi:paraquat-inducible protein B
MSSRQANPTIIGAFVLGALVLGIITVMQLASGRWFQERRPYIMYFPEAAQGLQVGAPVVFLGVRVGTVRDIQLNLEQESRRYLVLVTIEIEQQKVSTGGGQLDLQVPAAMQGLVEQGLRAQLRIQSLLTGQLYIDLNFHPDKPAQFYAADTAVNEIPTVPTTVEELTTLLEDFPMDEFLANLSGMADSISSLLAEQSVHNIPHRLDTTLSHLESLTARLDSASDPLLEKIETDLTELSHTLQAARSAMAGFEEAAGKAGKILDGDSELLRNVNRAGEELAAAAAGLREMTEQHSPTVYRLNQVLEELARAAQAVRQLAESLERQPEAILRGRQP